MTDWWSEDDEEQLLVEFEKMLSGQDNDYDSLGSNRSPKKDKCMHSWVFQCKSPVLDEDWYNFIAGNKRINVQHKLYRLAGNDMVIKGYIDSMINEKLNLAAQTEKEY